MIPLDPDFLHGGVAVVMLPEPPAGLAVDHGPGDGFRDAATTLTLHHQPGDLQHEQQVHPVCQRPGQEERCEKTQTEEGEKREVRAERFGKRWRLQAKVKGEESWTYYEVPLLSDLPAQKM